MVVMARFALLCIVLSCVYCLPVPKLIPFGGVTSPSLPSISFGQLVIGISDLLSFTITVAAVSGSGGDVAVAYVAVWNNNMTGPVLGSVPITLPTRDLGYTPITPNLQIARLDPAQIYVIYFNVTSRSKYEVLTSYTANGGAGGFVKAVGSVWGSSFGEDAVFSLSFASVLQLNPDFNFAQSHEPSGWQCLVNTTYSCIQVNWQTLKANTYYLPCARNRNLRYGPQSCLTSTYAVYGVASACWDLQYQQSWSYAYADLSGTPYKFAPNSWLAAVGFLPNGWARYSNNDQTVDIAGSGDCGFSYVSNQPNEVTGGFYLDLVRL